ncbi:MAG: peptidylprolyl isomerase, partial [Deferrisomatales bacterium]
QQAYNGLVRLYQEAYKEELTNERLRQLGLGRRAVDQLVDQTLMLQEAERRRLKATDEELQKAIEAVQVFQDLGAFSKDRYVRVLESNRISPLEYETSKRRELALGKVEQAIRAEATVTDAEVEAEHRDRNTKIELEFLGIAPDAVLADVRPTDEALREFYEAEKETYRTPERRAARYVLFSPEPYTASVTVTDEEVKEEYGWRADEFAVGEAVKARHILFRLAPDATDEDTARAREKAMQVRAELLKGADFAALAAKHSEDPGSRDQGGELGFFARGEMVPEFEQVAFALPAGAVSDPVKTSFGFHLIQVTSHRPAQAGSFDDVKEQIGGEIRRRKALEVAYAAADNLLMDVEDGKETWEGLEQQGRAKITPVLARDGSLTGVDKADVFLETLFAMAPTKHGELLETPSGTYLFAVAKLVPSAVPPLEEVRDAVVAGYRKVEAKRIAEKRSRDLLDAVRRDGWDPAVKAAGLPVQKTESFAKKGGAVPKIGWAPDLKEAAFRLTEVGTAAQDPVEVNGTFYAFRLAARTEAPAAGLGPERETLRAELLPKKQGEHFQTYLEELRKRSTIEVNEELLY